MMKRAKNIEVRQVAKTEQKSRLLKNKETSESLKITPPNFYNSTLVEFADMSVSYEDRIICDKVNFKIRQGDKIALKGKNGCGKTILRKLDFSREQFDNNIENFSGGQKKKVLIARSLCEKAHLYVWDEPLNFIDVILIMQIEELLLKFQPTIIFSQCFYALIAIFEHMW